MTNLFNRFKYQIQADFHYFFDKKATKNPINLLNQYIREAEVQLNNTGKLLERQGQVKVELEKELALTNEMLEKRTKQLQLAEETEETDLIAFAQQEVEAYSTRKQQLLISIDANVHDYFELERKYETMKHKVKDMKVRQLQLMSKENVTRAHYQMDKVIHQNAQNADSVDDLYDYIENLATNIDSQYEVTSFEARLEQLQKVKQSEAVK
jgi:lia operon protein LiaH